MKASSRASIAILIAAVAAAVTLTSLAAAGPGAPRQRVVITMKNLPSGQFVLDPQAGALKRDSGTTSAVYTRVNVVMRSGQRVEIYRTTFTLTGRRGSLTTQERLDWVDTGGPFIGTGIWKVVRGTGQYARVAGGGRTAHAGLDRGNGDWYVGEQGFLTRP